MKLTGNVAINADVNWMDTVTGNKKTQVYSGDVQRHDGVIVTQAVFMGDWINAVAGRKTVMEAFYKELNSRLMEQAHSAIGLTLDVKAAAVPADVTLFPAEAPAQG